VTDLAVLAVDGRLAVPSAVATEWPPRVGGERTARGARAAPPLHRRRKAESWTAGAARGGAWPWPPGARGGRPASRRREPSGLLWWPVG
jgi:hypothetical protein